MAKKKANGEGTIYRKGNGYELQITIGTDPITGKIKRKSFSGRTKKDVLEKRDNFITEIKTGTYVEPRKSTVSEWLTTWLELYKKGNIAGSTLDTCETHINVHLKPTIGNIKLQNLKTEDIQRMYNEKFNNGAGLKEETIRHIHATLKQCLEKSVELNYIYKNPAKYCILPKDNTETKVNVIYAEDLKKIIDALDKDNTYDVLILLDLVTGARKGEIIPIKWADIDFNKKTLTINKAYSRVLIRNKTEDENNESKGSKYENIIKPPKTRSSIRPIPLPEDIIPILEAHKLRIEKMILEKEIKGDGKKLVFPSEKGTLLSPQNITRRWTNILKKAGVEYKTFHSLRHSFASLLLDKNVNIKNIQELLGHSSIKTTLDIYSHVSGVSKQVAISKINYLLQNEDCKEDENKIKEANILYVAS